MQFSELPEEERERYEKRASIAGHDCIEVFKAQNLTGVEIAIALQDLVVWSIAMLPFDRRPFAAKAFGNLIAQMVELYNKDHPE